MNFDMRTILWMDAVIYLVLPTAIWWGLSSYRSLAVMAWSLAGLCSAVGLALIGSSGWQAEIRTDDCHVIRHLQVIHPGALQRVTNEHNEKQFWRKEGRAAVHKHGFEQLWMIQNHLHRLRIIKECHQTVTIP